MYSCICRTICNPWLTLSHFFFHRRWLWLTQEICSPVLRAEISLPCNGDTSIVNISFSHYQQHRRAQGENGLALVGMCQSPSKKLWSSHLGFLISGSSSFSISEKEVANDDNYYCFVVVLFLRKKKAALKLPETSLVSYCWELVWYSPLGLAAFLLNKKNLTEHVIQGHSVTRIKWNKEPDHFLIFFKHRPKQDHCAKQIKIANTMPHPD